MEDSIRLYSSNGSSSLMTCSSAWAEVITDSDSAASPSCKCHNREYSSELHSGSMQIYRIYCMYYRPKIIFNANVCETLSNDISFALT